MSQNIYHIRGSGHAWSARQDAFTIKSCAFAYKALNGDTKPVRREIDFTFTGSNSHGKEQV